ncbi:LacI family DNA-binding transcriptional regulator, partial [Salmonella enterica subsp. enterica serovar Lubbock]|nr:LacI family DNA-binding transcriptional regulator [Salmonella enterica subsp. enterica serovar Lubbock]
MTKRTLPLRSSARETGERIAQIMEEINYIPNRAPAMLLNAQSYTLGVLIPSFQ